MSDTQKRTEATRAEWINAARKLTEAVMEACSEVVEDDSDLPDLRADITAAIREWDEFAWHTNPYLPAPPPSLAEWAASVPG